MPSFEDITIDYYKPFLAFAEANKWVEGKKEKTFGFNDVTTVKEFAAMLLRALGHDTTGENYPKVMELAKELKLFNGATVEENAPIVRGIAFILMNNTLETAPKGEDKALVYKLGYKEEPKPQGFVVTEAKAAGRKAIDVVFSKAVKESTLENISIMDGAKGVEIEKIMLDKDGMNVRLVLKNAAKQDAKYELAVKNVKAADGKETVEKFSATIFMTDQVRPEITGVEVINPKTLLIKATEPINKATTKGFDSMPEIKIDNVKATAKVYNTYKNEFTVELYKALAPGNYKVEVSGLKDFDGLIAKTEEFDITVVEDKEAPTVVEAKMLSVNRIMVVFNEPITQVGSFKVDKTPVNALNISRDEDDAKVVYLKLSKSLELGAVLEIAVEHRGQTDAVKNRVKDWTKFTFKVEDDTELPVVEEVFARKIGGSPYVVVKFSKNMLETAGKYTIKNANGVVIGNAKTPVNYAAWKVNDPSELRIPAAFLNNKNEGSYTITLEEFKDGSVRRNPLATTVETFATPDLKEPFLNPVYKGGLNTDKLYEARLFFNEDMDSTTLLDLKNYIFKGGFKYKGKPLTTMRASEADVSIKSIDYGSKEVVIEANDKNIEAFGRIEVIGLTDRAGNLISSTKNFADPGTPALTISTAELYRVDKKYLVDVYFSNSLKQVENGALKLVDTDEFISNLTLIDWDSHGNKATFEVFDDKFVGTDAESNDKATSGDQPIKVVVVDKTKVVDVFDTEITKTSEKVVDDKVAPLILDTVLQAQVNNIDYIKISDGSKGTEGTELMTNIFDEELKEITGTVVRTSNDSEPFSANLKAHTVVGLKDSIAFNVTDVLPVGEYEINITHARDNKDNLAEIGTNLRFKVAALKLDSYTETVDHTDNTGKDIKLNFTKSITGSTTVANYKVVAVKANGEEISTPITIATAAVTGKELKLTLQDSFKKVYDDNTLTDGAKLKVEILPAAGIKTDSYPAGYTEDTVSSQVVYVEYK